MSAGVCEGRPAASNPGVCDADRRDRHDQPEPPMVWYVVSCHDGVRRRRIPHDVATAIKWCDYDTVLAIRDAARDELLSRLW